MIHMKTALEVASGAVFAWQILFSQAVSNTPLHLEF